MPIFFTHKYSSNPERLSVAGTVTRSVEVNIPRNPSIHSCASHAACGVAANGQDPSTRKQMKPYLATAPGEAFCFFYSSKEMGIADIKGTPSSSNAGNGSCCCSCCCCCCCCCCRRGSTCDTATAVAMGTSVDTG